LKLIGSHGSERGEISDSRSTLLRLPRLSGECGGNVGNGQQQPGDNVSEVCTVERLMAELGLSGATRGITRKTTIADPAAVRPADRVQRQFRPPAPNRLSVADLTYVSTWSGLAYVAFAVDAYARGSWAGGSPTMATSMVLDAIEQAIWTRRQEGVLDLKDVVHHTDRGSQHTSIRFTERLAEAGIQPSVGATGSSYDNALAETITVCTRPS
jgi:putative transposase